MDYIHSKGICHRDIKPSNILRFQKTPNLILYKLADFGLSKKLKHLQSQTLKQFMTFEYAAPEQIEGQEDEQTVSDCWSAGIVFFKLCSDNVHPFDILKTPDS